MQCRNCKKEFIISELERTLIERVKVPAPTLCHQCSSAEGYAFWAFSNYHRRKCDLTGAEVITTFPSNIPFPIYRRAEWFGDTWQAPEMEVDLERSFFDQLLELHNKTPHYHMLGDEKSINSDYCDDAWECKDCYLSRSMVKCENLHYSYRNLNCRDSQELTFCFDSTECFDCVNCTNCYKTQYSANSRNCLDSAFLYDCRNCTNCFMCWNVRNGKYQILNVQYSKEEYEKKMAEFALGSREQIERLKQEMEQHIQINAYHRQDMNVQTETVSGNFLEKIKNAEDTFLWSDSENIVNCNRGAWTKEMLDAIGCWKAELCGRSVLSMEAFNTRYSLYSNHVSDSEYVEMCNDIANCFGCVGLKKKKFCILNKQYTENEYHALREKIIAGMKARNEYGKFFPPSFTYNGYNGTLAQIYFPKTKEEALGLGYFWETDDVSAVPAEPATTIPDDIKAVDDAILTRVFSCEETGRPFKFVKLELDFHRKYHIPLSRLHCDTRSKHRFKLITAMHLQTSECTECKKQITHYYPPEWGYANILCHACYEKRIG